MSNEPVPNKPSDSTKGGLSLQMIGAIIAGIYVLILILLNNDKTKIDFLFAHNEMPLWILLLLVAVVTLIGERLAMFAWRRHKKKNDD